MKVPIIEAARRWLLRRSFSGGRDAGDRRAVQTEFSSTVFSGEAEDWVAYLGSDGEKRCDEAPIVQVNWSDKDNSLGFRPVGKGSKALARCLDEAFTTLRKRIAKRPHASRDFDTVIFGNKSNGQTDLFIRTSPTVPSEGTREILLDSMLAPVATRIVLRASLVEDVLRSLADAGDKVDPATKLGLAWPVVRRVYSQLNFPSYPRDRFVEKIDVVTHGCLLAMNILYKKKMAGRLVPNPVGRVYEEYISRTTGIEPEHLYERHPYLRLLSELGFMLDERTWSNYGEEAQVHVRQYLDGRYLRLSLAGLMPDSSEAMAPMPYKWDGREVVTPVPKLGSYGILDDEDLDAWRRVEPYFDEMGYTMLRQTGIGEFGRVYDALNRENPGFPARVAIKVDRLRHRKKKKKAILEAQMTMQVGRDLAGCPHVIRVFDAGRLRKKKHTYHIIQLIDGETLDHLIGVTGHEHASVTRPIRSQTKHEEVEEKVEGAVGSTGGERWRRHWQSAPFTQPLTISQALDLLTSVLLWVEEVHRHGYSVNDLKNGNIMVSRRGQVKGIDMDTYAPFRTSMDKATDFYFLGVSMLLMLMNVPEAGNDPTVFDPKILKDRKAMAAALEAAWPARRLNELSAGRVEEGELLELLLDIIGRCRGPEYANDAVLFTTDIDRLIRMKRRIFLRELVLD